MKRLIAICLLLCSVISLVACANIGVSVSPPKTDPTVATNPTGVQSTTLSTTKPTTRPTTPSTTEHSTQPTAQSTTQSNPCAYGHTYKDGWCIYCLALDPSFDICDNGHTYENGWCVYCLNPDPNFDICANGHTYENGWCVYCLNPDPSVKPTTPPATLTEDEALQIATELLERSISYSLLGLVCDREVIYGDMSDYYLTEENTGNIGMFQLKITCCHSSDEMNEHIARYFDESLFNGHKEFDVFYDNQGDMYISGNPMGGYSYFNHRIVFYDDNTIIIDVDAAGEGDYWSERVTCVRKSHGFVLQKFE